MRVLTAIFALSFCLGVLAGGCGERAGGGAKDESTGGEMSEKVTKSDEQWREELSEQQFCVLRQKDTEAPFTGAYWDNTREGVYRCAGCGQELFGSDTKFKSGTGWPSFYDAVESGNVTTETDRSLGMTRTEALCSRCGGHLGHVFRDGPDPTGLRYCINSAALEFVPAGESEAISSDDAGGE